MRVAGLDPAEQRIGSSAAANLVAAIPGDVDRWVLVAAHYDHLGARGDVFYPGADDNAAAVAVLVEVGRALAAARPSGRGVVLAAFDAEEPPYFLTGGMGSAYWAAHPSVPLDRIDMMVCMDLVGHDLGPEGLPSEVRSSLFALGAERSAGTAAVVDDLARAEPGLVVRRLDAETIPPLSDYDAFWAAEVPFLFLTAGRSARYHTPADTPEHVPEARLTTTAHWLERFVRRTCARDARRVRFDDARDDASTLRSILELARALAPLSPAANVAAQRAEDLLRACDARGRLPAALTPEPARIVAALENALA